jgi:hypothetical protein
MIYIYILFFTGPIVIFDIYTLENINTQIKLGDIPSMIENPLDMEKQFILLGIIDFKIPPRLRYGSTKEIGHYTAICHRSGSYIEYNDLLNTEKKLKKSHAVTPHVLIYIQKNK